MFKFNFNTTGTLIHGSQHSIRGDETCNNATSNTAVCQPPTEVLPSNPVCKTQQIDMENMQISDTLTLLKGIITTDQAASALKNEGLVENDLIPGKYEGGFKLWECAIDLAAFLHRQQEDFPSLKVLELGCGHGLPGLVALLGGATVHFQDYNAEVLELLTIPTVHANWKVKMEKKNILPPVRYFSGDWIGLSQFLDNIDELGAGYDVILTTETIYTIEGMHSLYKCIKDTMKRPGGKCYVGAKSFYFGVGGGVGAFLDLIEKDGCMDARIVEVFDDGKSNRREIVLLTW